MGCGALASWRGSAAPGTDRVTSRHPHRSAACRPGRLAELARGAAPAATDTQLVAARSRDRRPVSAPGYGRSRSSLPHRSSGATSLPLLLTPGVVRAAAAIRLGLAGGPRIRWLAAVECVERAAIGRPSLRIWGELVVAVGPGDRLGRIDPHGGGAAVGCVPRGPGTEPGRARAGRGRPDGGTAGAGAVAGHPAALPGGFGCGCPVGGTANGDGNHRHRRDAGADIRGRSVHATRCRRRRGAGRRRGLALGGPVPRC